MVVADKKITNEPDTGYRLAGVATSLREYKFCHHLNQLLSCDFRKLKDIVFQTEGQVSQQFGVFRAELKDEEVCYTVFVNKTPGGCLLPEVSSFDYIIRVDGHSESAGMNILLNDMQRLIPGVVMCAEIPVKKIKSRERLIYEEEKEPRKKFKPKNISDS